MEKSDTVDGTISQIDSELKDMYATILLYDDLGHESFNRLLTRIEQAIEDEQSAWTQAEPEAVAEAGERKTIEMRCALCGRVGDGMVYDESLKGWVCASCPTPTIAADLRTLTARVSEAETTASPTGAAALQEARQHLLRATVAVELAHSRERDAAQGAGE